MIKYITIITFLLSLFTSNAQNLNELRVEGKAKFLETEIVGLKDQNGRFCSGIVVTSNLDGFAYDSNNGIVKIDDRPGKDVIYITEGERVLEVFLAGFKPLKIVLDELGIYPRQKEMWEITITGEKEIEMFPVTVLANPNTAKIIINGEPAQSGKPTMLPVGNNTLTITLDGYNSIEESIEVNATNVLFNYSLQKIQDVGLMIESTPSGATIFLDGIKVGTTPLSTFYKPGNYTLKIEKQGYLSYSETIDLSNPINKKSYSLEANIGNIRINSYSNSVVSINGQSVKPGIYTAFEPQLLNITVTNPKAQQVNQSVVLKKGDNLTLDIYPEIAKGSVRVAVTPFNAKVKLRGDANENYEAEGMGIFNQIPTGTYQLSVEADGYTTHSEVVSLSENQEITRNISLEKKTVTQTTGSYSNTSVSKPSTSGSTTNSYSNNDTQKILNQYYSSNKTARKKRYYDYTMALFYTTNWYVSSDGPVEPIGVDMHFFTDAVGYYGFYRYDYNLSMFGGGINGQISDNAALYYGVGLALDSTEEISDVSIEIGFLWSASFFSLNTGMGYLLDLEELYFVLGAGLRF